MRLATERVKTMSPLPFSTTTLIAHGAGSVDTAAAALGPRFGVLRASTTASTAASIASPIAPTAARRRHGLATNGRGGAGRPANSHAS